jgi:hypothetical protein
MWKDSSEKRERRIHRRTVRDVILSWLSSDISKSGFEYFLLLLQIMFLVEISVRVTKGGLGRVLLIPIFTRVKLAHLNRGFCSTSNLTWRGGIFISSERSFICWWSMANYFVTFRSRYDSESNSLIVYRTIKNFMRYQLVSFLLLSLFLLTITIFKKLKKQRKMWIFGTCRLHRFSLHSNYFSNNECEETGRCIGW